MIMQGDVKCLHCGFVSGQWIGESGSPVTAKGFRPSHGSAPADSGEDIQCYRCEGPVMLDDPSPVISSRRIRRIRRMRAQIAAMEAEQRDAA